MVELVHSGDAMAGWQVGSLEELIKALDSGVDFIVTQGSEAGGHVQGEIKARQFAEIALEFTKLPLIIAGSISGPEDVKKYLDMGISAVRLGSAFVASRESNAHMLYKNALLKTGPRETLLCNVFNLGWDAPHRVLKSCVDALAAFEGDIVATFKSSDEDLDIIVKTPLPPCDDMQGNIEAMAMYAGSVPLSQKK